ncbi:MAG: hypothetical protein ACJAVR_002008 [Paracoccaceae bacterium]|jgi:hypothetical protein
MMTKFRNNAVAFLAALMVISAHAATAATCSAIQLDGDVSGFSILGGGKQCQVGNGNNDNVGGGTLDVNTHNMFSAAASDWAFLTKWSLDASSPSIDGDSAYSGGGTYSDHITMGAGSDGQGGSFTVSQAARVTYSDIMVVLKGPNAFSYVGFIVEDIISASEIGDYLSVFPKATPGEFQDISHISFYGRSATFGVVVAPVPVPAALPLMAGALGLLVLLRRRRA